jgi:hypothetical protein
MKTLPLTTTALLCLTATAFARPQLHTESIGWINPNDIFCAQTSDHTCVVINRCGDCSSPLAFTWEGQLSRKQKYRVAAGTTLDIINEGQDNEAVIVGRNGQSDDNGYIYIHKQTRRSSNCNSR